MSQLLQRRPQLLVCVCVCVLTVCVFADMDRCNSVEHGCEHQCVSTPGSYYCVCPEGQSLQEDAKSCGSKSDVPQMFLTGAEQSRAGVMLF